MSIVIDMKMPKCCCDCLLCIDGLRDDHDELCTACLGKKDRSPWGCGYKVVDGIDHTKEKMSWCPIKAELPAKHGRLIDADKLIIDLMDRGLEGIQTDDYSEIQQTIIVQDTVIEAEGKA